MFTHKRFGEILTARGFEHAADFTEAAPNQQGYTNKKYTLCVKTFDTLPLRVWYAGIPGLMVQRCYTENEFLKFLDKCESTYNTAKALEGLATLNL